MFLTVFDILLIQMVSQEIEPEDQLIVVASLVFITGYFR